MGAFKNESVEESRQRMEKQGTTALYRIWETEFRSEWTEDQFEVIGAILRSRGEPIVVPVVEQIEKMFVTTTPSVEGKNIEQYLGVVSSSVVLGTGLLSELGGGIADFLGKRAEGFQKKFSEAKELALRELKEQAVNLGSDGIIGIEFDYMSLTGNLLMVAVSGTAIKFASSGEKEII
jgi:uncharacterized protein YbjQ (UPF0145 family)